MKLRAGGNIFDALYFLLLNFGSAYHKETEYKY
jgi:hypothetical protein